MSNGTYSDRALTSRGTRAERRVDPRTRIEVADHIGRLLVEAERERLARALRVSARSASVRSRVAHALMALGRFVEGSGTPEAECPSPLRA